MLLKSEDGDAYSEDQLGAWMSDAGFGDLRVEDLDPERQLITGVHRPR